MKGLICALVLTGAFVSTAWGQAAPTKVADAAPGDVRIFISNGIRGAVERMRPQLEQAAGGRLVMESGRARDVQSHIEAGQAFEVALLTDSVIDELIAKGKVAKAGRADIAMLRIGVAMRGDAPKPDISTPDALSKAVLGARSVRRNFGVGASVAPVDFLFEKMALGAAGAAKVVPSDNATPDTPPKPGEYDLFFNLASELVTSQAWAYLGLAPEPFQLPVRMTAGIGPLGDAKKAAAVLEVLEGPAFDPALAAFETRRN